MMMKAVSRPVLDEPDVASSPPPPPPLLEPPVEEDDEEEEEKRVGTAVAAEEVGGVGMLEEDEPGAGAGPEEDSEVKL